MKIKILKIIINIHNWAWWRIVSFGGKDFDKALGELNDEFTVDLIKSKKE